MKRSVFTTIALLMTACTGDAPRDLAPDHAVPEDAALAAGAVQEVCGRTPQVRDEIVRVTSAGTCDVVTSQDLAGISTWDLAGSEIEALREGDFAGLSNLHSLDLGHWSAGPLTALPEAVFADLSSLKSLDLYGRDLTTLPPRIFAGLSNLQSLDLAANELTTLPPRIFARLSNLQTLDLAANELTTLPEAVFTGLSSLESLDLGSNELTMLPPGVFVDLSSLQSLDLYGNDLSTLPAQVFAGLPNLESLRLSGNALTLDLSGNNLTVLPEPVFSGLSSLASLHLEYSPGSPSEIALDSWCTVQHAGRGRATGDRAAGINFRLNGKTVSICAGEGVSTFFFGDLDAEPELRYSGRILASLGGPAFHVDELESKVLSDLADWSVVEEEATRELLVTLSDVRNTNGFVELYGWTGDFTSACYIFRNRGWQYEVCSVAGRTFNYQEGTEEHEKLATYATYSLTLRSPEGNVYSFEKTVGEPPFVG